MKKDKKFPYIMWGAMLYDNSIGIPISKREVVIVNSYKRAFADHCKAVDNLF